MRISSKLNINSDFLSASVSGVDSSLFLVGRPFGGCAILYRKSLSLSISQIASVLLRLVLRMVALY